MSREFPAIVELSDERSSVLKQIRASFESKLQAEETSIEEWLTTVSGTEKTALLAELLDAEICFLREHGKAPSLESYVARFPDHASVVRAVFEFRGLVSALEIDDPLVASTIEAVAPDSMIADPTVWTAQDAVGRYRLVTLLGTGGFGEVWKAYDPDLCRHVAVKLAKRRTRLPGNTAASFREEAKKAASLKIAGIVPVFDVGQTERGIFIVSELVEGPTLAQRMKAAPIPREEAVRIVLHVAKTLHQAHLAGLVHRDVKPSNILLRPDGMPAITDFGLAISEVEQLDDKSRVVGTLLYMSPEQARGESQRVDGRSDLYSIGVILFQLLTNRDPFQHRNSTELFEQILHREVRPLRSIDDKIPPELERICLKCLSKNIVERYLTGDDLAADLKNFLDQNTSRNARVGVSGRNLSAIAVAVTAVVIIIAAGLNRGCHQNPPVTVIRPGSSESLAKAELDQWVNMLDRPLEQITNDQGDSLDFLDHKPEKKMLIVRSERNQRLVATPLEGAMPLKMRATVSLDDWLGDVGFFWGLGAPSRTPEGKIQVCYAITIERYQQNEAVKLVLSELTVGDWVSGIRYIRHTGELASAEITRPVGPDAMLEIQTGDKSIAVYINSELVWTAVSSDSVTMAAMTSSRGVTGFVARGKTVAFRDATVMFLSTK